jgi:hypothetical protein
MEPSLKEKVARWFWDRYPHSPSWAEETISGYEQNIDWKRCDVFLYHKEGQDGCSFCYEPSEFGVKAIIRFKERNRFVDWITNTRTSKDPSVTFDLRLENFQPLDELVAEILGVEIP